eukprot:CAMPEP_0202891058 /NCGR_PEP_ID=MMETSP1392-20130828/1244_1 /ASSEMBLY_ACC=CAM_ASM_000868 /TAXON_ID=225041 /ORGANISM="Chlamydomonas chlamydogama, Strain SAG 11-48b" /LENGTH=39 /DNA_ID= /DNA_START= /DNA_END= /DNA_ORIENTATION=
MGRKAAEVKCNTLCVDKSAAEKRTADGKAMYGRCADLGY